MLEILQVFGSELDSSNPFLFRFLVFGVRISAPDVLTWLSVADGGVNKDRGWGSPVGPLSEISGGFLSCSTVDRLMCRTPSVTFKGRHSVMPPAVPSVIALMT